MLPFLANNLSWPTEISEISRMPDPNLHFWPSPKYVAPILPCQGIGYGGFGPFKDKVLQS